MHLDLDATREYFIQHIFEYLLVFLILVTCALTLFLTPDEATREAVVFGTAALYPLWAIFHHWEEGTLKASTILEYLAFTALILWTLLVVF